jgi:hypothetical protein
MLHWLSIIEHLLLSGILGARHFLVGAEGLADQNGLLDILYLLLLSRQDDSVSDNVLGVDHIAVRLADVSISEVRSLDEVLVLEQFLVLAEA